MGGAPTHHMRAEGAAVKMKRAAKTIFVSENLNFLFFINSIVNSMFVVRSGIRSEFILQVIVR